jgi:hypothetical protein
MATVVEPFIKRLSEIKADLNNIAKQIIIDNSEFIINLLKYGQLEEGLNSSGEVVGRYSFHTQGYANSQNISTPKKFGDPYNFNWTGETIDNLKIGKINKNTYEITTIQFKKDLLENLYGEIFDFTEENNDYVNMNILLPNLQEYIITESVRGLI